MSLCVCVRVHARTCTHLHGCVSIYMYIYVSSALPTRIVYGNLGKTTMFAGFAITHEGVTSKLGKTWMYGASVHML